MMFKYLLSFCLLLSFSVGAKAEFSDQDLVGIRDKMEAYLGISIYVTRDLVENLSTLEKSVDWQEAKLADSIDFKNLQNIVHALDQLTHYMAVDERGGFLQGLILSTDLILYGRNVIKLGEKQERDGAFEPSELSQLAARLNLIALQPFQASKRHEAQTEVRRSIRGIQRILGITIDLGIGRDMPDLSKLPKEHLTQAATHMAIMFSLALPLEETFLRQSLVSDPPQLSRARRQALNAVLMAEAMREFKKGIDMKSPVFSPALTLLKGYNKQSKAMLLSLARDIHAKEAQFSEEPLSEVLVSDWLARYRSSFKGPCCNTFLDEY